MAGWHNIIEHNKQIHTNSKTYHKLPRCGTSESKHNLTRASTARTALNCSSCSSVLPAKSQELTRTTSSEDVVPWGRRTEAAKKEIDDTDYFFVSAFRLLWRKMDTVLILQRLLQSLGQMSRVCLGIATCGTSAVWAQMLVVHCVTTRWNQFKDRSDVLVNCLRLTHTKQILTNHGMRWHHVKSGLPRQRASTKLSRPIATFSPQERRELGWIMCNSASMCKRVQVCVCVRECVGALKEQQGQQDSRTGLQLRHSSVRCLFQLKLQLEYSVLHFLPCAIVFFRLLYSLWALLGIIRIW